MDNQILRQEVDCLVVGGGPAGYAAALAASRSGCRTLIVERHGFFGGMATAAGLSAYINYRHDGNDLSDSVYRGLISALKAENATYQKADGHVDVVEVEAVKQVMEDTLIENGVILLYHAVLDTIDQSDRKWELRFLTKGSSVKIGARYVVDATGDADVSARVGAEMTYGRAGDGKMQPMSMLVYVGGFNPARYEAAGYELVQGKYAIQGECFQREIIAAREDGDWSIPRTEVAMFWSTPYDPTRVCINATRVIGRSGCHPFDLSLAETEGRQQSQELVRFLRKYAHGFEDCYLQSTGPQIGVRETRRIIGLATLTERDVLASVIPNDAIAECAYPIDIHQVDGSGTRLDGGGSTLYGIPYRCLLPRGVRNIIAAGRCISASHEAAGSFRVMPTCMSIGEAAGIAVGQAAEQGVDLSALDGGGIRARMIGSRQERQYVATA